MLNRRRAVTPWDFDNIYCILNSLIYNIKESSGAGQSASDHKNGYSLATGQLTVWVVNGLERRWNRVSEESNVGVQARARAAGGRPQAPEWSLWGATTGPQLSGLFQPGERSFDKF